MATVMALITAAGSSGVARAVQSAAPVSDLPFVAFGPESFVRGTGGPKEVTKTFTVLNPDAAYTLRVANGGADGKSERVSSGVLRLNGSDVVGSSDFSQNVAVITKAVKLAATNTLGVELRSKPGSVISVQVVGMDNDLPTITASTDPPPGPDGTYTTDVTVRFTCADKTSGIATCPAPVTVTTEGTNQVVTGTAVDRAGHTADATVTLSINKRFRIASTSPTNTEDMVNVTREAVINFSAQVDPASVTNQSLSVMALGQPVPGRRVVSSTRRFVTFFPDGPWPASTEIRVAVDGNVIRNTGGTKLDADGDGVAGGVGTIDFTTLSLTRIPNTNVFGFVRDSYSQQPIVGATIRVDAFPEANATTNQAGRFELKDMPAPEFFVHVDGSTASNPPAGFMYPSVGKPFHSVPGQTQQLIMDGKTFDVFLPPMSMGDVTNLSPTAPTNVSFGPAGIGQLNQLFPSTDPAVWARTSVKFEPRSAVDEAGKPATQALIIPVPPDRIPAPLPSNLKPRLVISVQAIGATNFDVPAQATFPNLDGLAPGEKALFFSFDHDAGRWAVIGPGTVSADGLGVVTDPGVGIQAPGWHLVQVGTMTAGKPCVQGQVCVQGSGKRGDVIRVDLSGTGGRNFAIDPGSFTGGRVALDDSNPPVPISAGGSIGSTGIFYIVADISASATLAGEGTGPPDIVGTFTAESPGCSCVETATVNVSVSPGYSTTGDGMVTFNGNRLSAYRQQQRLKYLGFLGADANPLTVTGSIAGSPNTQHAIGVFNSAVGSVPYNPGTAFTNAGMSFINATNGPRWQSLPSGKGWGSYENVNGVILIDQKDFWGTSWAFTVLNIAGSANTSSKRLLVRDISSKAGGAYSGHVSHTAGMKIDVDTEAKEPAGGAWTVPFYLTHDLGSPSKKYVASPAVNGVDMVIVPNVAPGGGYTTAPTTGDLTSAVLHQASNCTDMALMDGIGALLADAPAYKIEDVKRQMQAFANLPASGPSVSGLISNDPRTRAISSPPVRFLTSVPHCGHFHVDAAPPAQAVQSTFSLQGAGAVPDPGPAATTQRAQEGVIRAAVAGPALASGFGNDPRLYYRFILANGLELRGRSSAAGQFSEILTPDVDYSLTLFQASTNRSGVFSGRSSRSGIVTDLGLLVVGQVGGLDTDGDGLPDVGELAIGTNQNSADTDGDGITDSAEIAQGLNPLDNRGFPTGVISSLPLPGPASGLAVDGDSIYAATGSHGLAIVDGKKFDSPILLGQIDLPGTASDVGVDGKLKVAAVATGATLELVDLTDPMAPTVRASVPVAASQVEVFGGFAYVASVTSVSVVDLGTGQIIHQVTLPGSGNITGLAREGDKLYAYVSGSDLLVVIDIANPEAAKVVGQLGVPVASSDVGLFVGSNIAWVVGSGLRTVNVTNPASPQLIHGADSFFTARRMALNGSGLGLLTPDGANSIEVYDTSNPNATSGFLTRFNVSGPARGVAISRGLGYVAAGNRLEVVNYRAFDTLGRAPTVSISSPVADRDPSKPGIQVLEGGAVPVVVNVTDDVQVRSVELVVDGRVTATDVSFPFDFSAVAVGNDPQAPAISVQVRAVDTGGNSALSNTLVIDLVPDTFPPTIDRIDPGAGEVRGEGHNTVRVRFSEPVKPDGIDTTTFRVVGAGPNRLFDDGDDVVIPVRSVLLRDDDSLVQLTTDPLVIGLYQLRVDRSRIADRKGNVMGTGTLTSGFEIVKFVPITINFNAGSGAPRSYTESGLTVTSGQDHLHMAGNLLNHSSCCSTPYTFVFAGGAPFSVLSFDIVGGGGGTFTSSKGGIATPTGSGTVTFGTAAWTNITSFSWDQPAPSMTIDNLVISAVPS